MSSIHLRAQILAGFKLINKNQPIAKVPSVSSIVSHALASQPEYIDVMLTDQQAAYFKGRAKPASGVQVARSSTITQVLIALCVAPPQIGQGFDYTAFVEEVYKE